MLPFSVTCNFFFQAEDGIRDPLVTGVQTCALPIFLLGKLGKGAVHAPGGPARLGALLGPWVARGLVHRLGGHGPERAAPVDNRVPRDRVEPGRSRPTVAAVALRRAPDRGERLLDGGLGAAAATHPPQARR